MKNYKIILRSSGTVTQLPDSQKIFGAMVTELSRMQGGEAAAEFVRKVYNREAHLALSNLFPLGFLPVPQDYIMEKLAERVSEEKKPEENLKKLRAQIRERAYIREEKLNFILKNPSACCSVYPYIREVSGQQLRASLERGGWGIEDLEKKLFTVPVTILREISRDDESESRGRTVSEFCFYLQGDSGQTVEPLVSTAEQMKRTGRPLILGKRASQGLNKYYVDEIMCMEEELADSDKGVYLNLGMLLPDQIDYKESCLKLFTSERKPFSMPGGWNQTYPRWFISFISCGSVVALKNGIEHAGRCIWSKFGEDKNLVFGNAFLYPINL